MPEKDARARTHRDPSNSGGWNHAFSGSGCFCRRHCGRDFFSRPLFKNAAQSCRQKSNSARNPNRTLGPAAPYATAQSCISEELWSLALALARRQVAGPYGLAATVAFPGALSAGRRSSRTSRSTTFGNALCPFRSTQASALPQESHRDDCLEGSRIYIFAGSVFIQAGFPKGALWRKMRDTVNGR